MTSGDGETAAFLDRWARAERDGDTGALDGLLADDFIGVGPLGFLLSKQDWLKRFAGGLRYDEFSLEEPRERRYGDTAVIVGQQNQSGTFGGNPLPFSTVRATLVLASTSGAWQLAGVHMSFIAGTPGAPPLPGR